MKRKLGLALFAVLAVGCGSGDDASSSATTTPSGATETTAHPVAPLQPVTADEGDTPDASEVPDEPDGEDASETDASGDDAPGTASAESTATADSTHPDIIAARATREDNGTWRFDVTVSSPYDTPERYADAWRVLGPDGTELGVRILTHDHASEQPFTRSQRGIEISDEISTVTIEGRDLANGWGGGSLELELPPS